MTDDPAQIRAAARRAHRLATDVRRSATTLSRAQGVQWHSNASALFRQRLRDRGREMDRCAAGLTELGERLSRHARAVESQERAITMGLEVAGQTPFAPSPLNLMDRVPGGGILWRPGWP